MNNQPLAITVPHFNIAHGFFTRLGGVSSGVYHSLNCGLGSKDEPTLVQANRARALAHLGLTSFTLAYVYQTHSPTVITLSGSQTFHSDAIQEADALVTNQPDIALSILTADCCPILFYDEVAHIIGIAHAGWKGAFSGIIEHTVQAMVALGSKAQHIQAAIGPTIAQRSYEVDHVFYQRFIEQSHHHAAFFIPSLKEGHYLFDLPSYNRQQLTQSGVTHIHDTERDTYSDPEHFFSYRRMCHQQEADFGRMISIISLKVNH